MKEKVIKRLVKLGNNEKEAVKMVEGSEWALRSYSTPSKITEAIISTYGISGVQR